ncbi:MAG: hypothetical protein LBV69_02825 [Bacteroidales bacterium]|jgi:hypothetical protein|nr:hypothetical protein [Bacteroidales bacterium]
MKFIPNLIFFKYHKNLVKKSIFSLFKKLYKSQRLQNDDFVIEKLFGGAKAEEFFPIKTFLFVTKENELIALKFLV